MYGERDAKKLHEQIKNRATTPRNDIIDLRRSGYGPDGMPGQPVSLDELKNGKLTVAGKTIDVEHKYFHPARYPIHWTSYDDVKNASEDELKKVFEKFSQI